MNPVGTLFENGGRQQSMYQQATAFSEERVKLPAPKPTNIPGVKPGTQFFKTPSLVSEDGGDGLRHPHGTQPTSSDKKYNVPDPRQMNQLASGGSVPLPPYIDQSPSPVNPVNVLFDSTYSGSRRAEEAVMPIKMPNKSPTVSMDSKTRPPQSQLLRVGSTTAGITGKTAPPERRRNSVSSSSRSQIDQQSTQRPPPTYSDSSRKPTSVGLPHPDFVQFSATPGSEPSQRLTRTQPQKLPPPPPPPPQRRRESNQMTSNSSISDSDYSEISSSMTLMEMQASRSRIIAEVKVIQRDLNDMEVTGNSNPRELSKMRRRLGELQGILRELLLDMEVHQRSPWRKRWDHGVPSNRSKSKRKERVGMRREKGVRPMAVSGSTTATQQATDHQRLVAGLLDRQQSEVEAARMRYEEQIRKLQSTHLSEQSAQQHQMQREQDKLLEYEQAIAKAGALKQQLQLAQAEVVKNETALHATSLMFSNPHRSQSYLEDGLPSHNHNHHLSLPTPYHSSVQSASPVRGRPAR